MKYQISIGLAAFAVIGGSLLMPSIWRQLSVKPYERAIMAMDQNANVKTRFWGRVVDQDGKPVAGAVVSVAVTGINPDWAISATKERGTRVESKTTTSVDGMFEVPVEGDKLVINEIICPGFAWLFDENLSERSGTPFGWNRSFRMAINGHAGPYVPDKDSPAIFVLVGEGEQQVRVRPSRGGVDNNAGRIRKNGPVWPDQPSLKGVRFVEPTTMPG